MRRVPPKRGPSPGQPFRGDVAVYNEATGFLITSRKMGGREIDSSDEAWAEAVERGDLLPIELVQDDSFVIRVVLGAELAAQESEKWIGRLSWKLNVPDGRLVVAGGMEFVRQPLDAKESGESKYVRILDVPAGDYRADLYSYLNGVNGEYLLGRAAPQGTDAEPAGAYFRRTRQGQEFPHWLRSWCTAYPDMDPRHEDEWEDAVPEDGPEYVDFLLHLSPLEDSPSPGPKMDRGWFGVDAHALRKPARCPIGIEAKDVSRPAPERPRKATRLPTIDVLSRVAAYPPVAVAGGPVEVPISRLARRSTVSTSSAIARARWTTP